MEFEKIIQNGISEAETIDLVNCGLKELDLLTKNIKSRLKKDKRYLESLYHKKTVLTEALDLVRLHSMSFYGG